MFYNFYFENLSKIGPVVLLLMYSSVSFAAENISGQQVVGTQEMVSSSRSPEQHLTGNEIIPPPPPGPFMSTALRGDASNRLATRNDRQKPDISSQVSNVPIDAFSPDRPWPDDLRASDRQMPENVNNAARPPVTKYSNQKYLSSSPEKYRDEQNKRSMVNNFSAAHNPAMGNSQMGYMPNRSNPSSQQNRYNRYPPVYQGGTPNMYQQPVNQLNPNSYPLSNMPRHPY